MAKLQEKDVKYRDTDYAKYLKDRELIPSILAKHPNYVPEPLMTLEEYTAVWVKDNKNARARGWN